MHTNKCIGIRIYIDVNFFLHVYILTGKSQNCHYLAKCMWLWRFWVLHWPRGLSSCFLGVWVYVRKGERWREKGRDWQREKEIAPVTLLSVSVAVLNINVLCRCVCVCWGGLVIVCGCVCGRSSHTLCSILGCNQVYIWLQLALFIWNWLHNIIFRVSRWLYRFIITICRCEYICVWEREWQRDSARCNSLYICVCTFDVCLQLTLCMAATPYMYILLQFTVSIQNWLRWLYFSLQSTVSIQNWPHNIDNGNIETHR